MVNDQTDGATGEAADQVPPQTPPKPQFPDAPHLDPYAVISYLLSGVILYGGIGWLVDWWLGTRGFVGAGIAIGAAAGVWLVWLRYSRS